MILWSQIYVQGNGGDMHLGWVGGTEEVDCIIPFKSCTTKFT